MKTYKNCFTIKTMETIVRISYKINTSERFAKVFVKILYRLKRYAKICSQIDFILLFR